MSDGAKTFEDLALQQGLITARQLAECRTLRDNVVAQGLACEIEEVLLKKGWVTKAQAAALHAAQGRGNKTAIEGYEILAKLGAGGQGAVYKARQSSMGRLVAIKILLPNSQGKDGVERFLREAKAIARLNHPNIVSGIDAGCSNGAYYCVMEYLEGEALDRKIARQKKIPWQEAASILEQMASALEHARRNGLIHRDIKPGNIHVGKDGTIKLLDLGMARFKVQDNLALTKTGFAVGTPYYMSPEQARGQEDLDIRADLYSLGITFYEMLAGTPPFTGKDALVVLNRHLKETVPFDIPGVPPELLAVGRRLTENDRRQRYATPALLTEDLRAFQEGRPIKAPPRSKTSRAVPVRRPSRAPLFIGIAAAAGLLALVIGASTSRKAPPEPVAIAAPPPQPRKTEPIVPAAPDPAAIAFKAVRDFELANPNDLEEIAERYGGLALQFPAYGGRAKEVADDLAAAIERKKRQLASLEDLERHGRDFRSAGWRAWIDAQRAKLNAERDAEAAKRREEAAAAERVKAAELARAKRAEEELRIVDEFLGKAPAWARDRDYDAWRVPSLDSREAKERLRRDGALLMGAQDVFTTAWAHARELKGKPIRFEMRDGTKASGDVTAASEKPAALLLGGTPYYFRAFSSASVAALYKAAKGVDARPEALLGFAVYDGDVAATAELLKRTGLTLDARAEAVHQENQRRLAEARKPEPPPPAKKAAEKKAAEVVVYASELPAGAVAPDFEIWNEPSSPGGKMVGMAQRGSANDPPPEIDAICTFKVQVREGLPYRCWTRMKVGKAEGKSQANLLWLQFTGAVSKSGKDLYTLGTADYATLQGPAKEGWAWVGPNIDGPIYFKAAGEVTVRIYAGHEGVGFDQFVLSPSRYLEAPPTEAVVPHPRK